jgi:DNA-binding Xre family transcriptional regulator
MTRTELRRKAGFTTSALANMGKGNYVSLEIIEKICTVLECKVEDIVEIKPGE